MIPSLAQDIQDELEQLAQRYGVPLVRTVELTATSLFDPLTKRDRYGEVCMVVRRPNGRLLTMTKTFYPAGAYRLLTGGINHGEHIFDALLRETQEETGLTVAVKHFLVATVYYATHVSSTPVFYTFAFLLDEIGGTLGAIDEEERVEAFREIEPHELLDLAEYLEHLQRQYSEEIDGALDDWGQFRAAIHRLVWEALQHE